MYTTVLASFLSALVICSRYRKRYDAFLQRLNSMITYFTAIRYYVFYEEYSMPFLCFELNNDHPLTGQPTLIYDAESTLFFPYHTEKTITGLLDEYIPQPLPILSMEIIDESSNSAHDLTGFIETLRYVEVPNYPAPTICDIIGAWSASNSIPVDRTRFQVRYITSDGDEIIASLTSTSLLGTEAEPEPETKPVEPVSDDENGD